MSYLERLDARAGLSAGAEPAKGAKGGFDPFESAGTGHFHGLPAACADGLARLQAMPTPRITRPEVWLAIVADALRLARDGWAAQALALGWSIAEIWGCSPVRSGNPDHDGLAVWIDGRRVLLLDDGCCIVETGPNARSVYNRRGAGGATLLWDLGRESAGAGR